MSTNRSKVATAIMEHVVQHLRDNPNATNIEIARAVARVTDYSVNTIRVTVPLALRMAQKQVKSEEPNTLTAADTDKTATTYAYDDFVYTFTFTDAPNATLERRVVKDLVWFYSNRGGKLSKRQAAAKIRELHGEVLSEKFTHRILAAMGVNKTSPPFPPHLKDRYTPTELEKMRFARIDAEIEMAMNAGAEDKWRRQYEAAVSHTNRVRDVAVAMSQAFSQVPQREVIRPYAAELEGLAVVGLFDLHFGKGGTRETLDEQLATFAACVHDLTAKILASCRPDRTVVVLGGDVLHVDTAGGTTSAGTPQEMNGTVQEIVSRGVRAVCDAIDILRTLGQLEIIVVEGNHDRVLSFALRTALHLRYDNVADVNVSNGSTARAYFSYGDSLFMATHGDGAKPSQYSVLMASEAREKWGASKHAYVFAGHLHHTYEYDVNGATVLQCPSPAQSDTWHDFKGYTTSRAALRAFLFDAREGHVGTWSTYPAYAGSGPIGQSVGAMAK